MANRCEIVQRATNKKTYQFTLLPSSQPKALFTRREGYPSKRVTLARTQLFLFSLSCLQGGQGARVGGLPYLRARVTLASELTFSLVNTPGRVNPPTRG